MSTKVKKTKKPASPETHRRSIPKMSPPKKEGSGRGAGGRGIGQKKKVSKPKPKVEKVAAPKVVAPKVELPKKKKVTKKTKTTTTKKVKRSEGIPRAAVSRLLKKSCGITNASISAKAVSAGVMAVEHKLDWLSKRVHIMLEHSRKKTVTKQVLLRSIDECHLHLKSVMMTSYVKDGTKAEKKADDTHLASAPVVRAFFKNSGMVHGQGEYRIDAEGIAAIVAFSKAYLTRLGKASGSYTDISKRKTISVADVAHALETCNIV